MARRPSDQKRNIVDRGRNCEEKVGIKKTRINKAIMEPKTPTGIKMILFEAALGEGPKDNPHGHPAMVEKEWKLSKRQVCCSC